MAAEAMAAAAWAAWVAEALPWAAWVAEALPCIVALDSAAVSLGAESVQDSADVDSGVASDGTATGAAAFGPINGGHGALTKPILISEGGAGRARVAEREQPAIQGAGLHCAACGKDSVSAEVRTL
jgi:hypothetical protein